MSSAGSGKEEQEKTAWQVCVFWQEQPVVAADKVLL